MKKGNAFFIVTLFSMLFLAQITACKKKDDPAATRSFYMGVTPWPADFTEQAVADAYRFIDAHCDLVAHHFDEGIPYEEALNGGPMPDSLRAAVQFRKSKHTGKTVFLSVAALNLSRHEKAEYYQTASPADSVKQYWKQLPVNDAKVVTAYVNYISYLVNELTPAFVNYGVESNDISWDLAKFNQYKDFLSKVYTQLKAKYPGIPFFVSLMVNDVPQAMQLAVQLLPYTDYITLSAYPYTHAASTANGNTDPSLFPANYFTRFIELDPAKPWAFAETAYIAEDLVVPSFNLNKRGTDQWQKDYLELVCKLCQDRKARFLVWFCHKDYDAANNKLRSLGLYQDLFALWEDTGLYDENGRLRPAGQQWIKWMNK